MASIQDHQWNIANFLKVAEDNTTETIDALPQAFEFIEQIDLLVREFISEAGDISPPLAGALLLNAHASFRAAFRLTLSGQLPPVFMALRGALESALYGNAVIQNRELQDIWLKRHSDQEGRNRCKNAFSIKKLLGYLTNAQGAEFTALIKDQYEACIDFGGHPNSRSVMSHLKLEELENSVTLEFAYLHGYKSAELRQSIIACAEIGISIINIALSLSKETTARTEIAKRAETLQHSIPDLIDQLNPIQQDA